MRYEQVYTFLIDKLRTELPASLRFHNVEHTVEVVRSCTTLANEEGISEEEKKLLLTAALFHDSGFLETYDNHEEASCKLAATYLPEYDYSQEQIDEICRLIRATKVPQQPSGRLEYILCDADLYNIGTGEFYKKADLLYQELESAGKITDRKEWQKEHFSRLQNHQYFTDSARKLLGARAKENLNGLISKKGPVISPHKHSKVQSGLRDTALITAGVIMAAFGLKGFLVPSHFVDGGVTGIALLLSNIYGFNLPAATFILNMPFVIAGYFVVSRQFALKTFICVSLLSLCLLFVEYPVITSDKLLIAIFGGVFLGIGSGLAMRAGCVTDGIEVLALYTWRKTSFTISEIILALNVLIFAVAAFQFGIEIALYSILTYLAATKTIDYVVEGVEAYTGVTIVSRHSEIIKAKVVNQLGRSITIYKGERGYLPNNSDAASHVDIIFCVITRLELRKLKNLVYEIDENAFVFANTIKEASGGIIKKRNLH